MYEKLFFENTNRFPVCHCESRLLTVNPISNTAITTLIMLANAGYEDATAILEKMGVDKEKIFHDVDPTDMINRPSDIVRELRYVALNRAIEESGFRTLMDLPCG